MDGMPKPRGVDDDYQQQQSSRDPERAQQINVENADGAESDYALRSENLHVSCCVVLQLSTQSGDVN
jgi:hypothetical protein